MAVLISYKVLLDRFPNILEPSGSNVRAKEDFLELVRLMLALVEVNDQWYREKYPDVSDAVDAGEYRSTRQHFIDHGYFEWRLPGRLTIDEAWYVNEYEDVQIGIENGEIASAEEHFNLHGYAEGRLPVKL